PEIALQVSDMYRPPSSFRQLSLLICFLKVFLALLPEGIRANEPCSDKTHSSKADQYGDPLPNGAIARLGTSRFLHGAFVRSIAYSPDGRWLVSGGDDNMVRLWDAASGKEIRCFTGHTHWVAAVCFAPDGR